MNKQARVTPINRLRERVLRWTNDSEYGQRFARWTGKTAAGLQLRLTIKSAQNIPWTPLKRPLSEATVALVATGGIHLCSDQPFDLASDASFRVIPRTALNEDLCISHRRYDRRDAASDPNLIFPLERLLELEREGVIGRVADVHYGFGFINDPQKVIVQGRKVASLLAQAGVDLVVLVPA